MGFPFRGRLLAQNGSDQRSPCVVANLTIAWAPRLLQRDEFRERAEHGHGAMPTLALLIAEFVDRLEYARAVIHTDRPSSTRAKPLRDAGGRLARAN